MHMLIHFINNPIMEILWISPFYTWGNRTKVERFAWGQTTNNWWNWLEQRKGLIRIVFQEDGLGSGAWRDWREEHMRLVVLLKLYSVHTLPICCLKLIFRAYKCLLYRPASEILWVWFWFQAISIKQVAIFLLVKGPAFNLKNATSVNCNNRSTIKGDVPVWNSCVVTKLLCA